MRSVKSILGNNIRKFVLVSTDFFLYNVGRVKNKMANKKVKTVYKLKWKNICVLLAAILLFVGVLFGIYWAYHFYKDYKSTMADKDKIHETVEVTNIVDDEKTKTIPPDSTLSKFDIYWDYIKLGLIDVDMASLMRINSDTLGFVEVKGTDFSYPIVRSNGGFYRRHSFDKTPNSNGWLYLDDDVNIEELSTNTVVYGNKLIWGSLFKDLDVVFKPEWNENDDNFVIRYYTNYYSTLWQVISVYKSDDKTARKTEFESEKETEDFISAMLKKSAVKFKASAKATDKFLTLTTNSGGENIVVFAKLIKIKDLQ